MGILSNGYWALFAANTYVASYEFGLGPLPSLMITEMYEGKYVAATMSLCLQINWVSNFAVGMAFPTMRQVLGKYTFVPFACFHVIFFIFAELVLPETHGRNPKDVACGNDRNMCGADKKSDSNQDTSDQADLEAEKGVFT